MWKNMADPDRPQMTIQYGPTSFACCITTATDTHSEYVINFVFPLPTVVKHPPQCYIIHTLPVMLDLVHNRVFKNTTNWRVFWHENEKGATLDRYFHHPCTKNRDRTISEHVVENFVLLNSIQWTKTKYWMKQNVIFHHQNHAKLGPKFFSKLWNISQCNSWLGTMNSHYQYTTEYTLFVFHNSIIGLHQGCRLCNNLTFRYKYHYKYTVNMIYSVTDKNNYTVTPSTFSHTIL